MKFRLDENLGRSALGVFEAAGHNVSSIHLQALVGPGTGAEGHLALRDERCERDGYIRLRDASEGAPVGEKRGPAHLLVPTPSWLGGAEVESTFLPEDREEFEAALGVDHFDQGRVDGLAEGGRAEDGSGLRCDISIDFNGCLAHNGRVFRVAADATELPRQHAASVVLDACRSGTFVARRGLTNVASR